MLLTEVTPPASLPPGGEITLAGKASWLVCADICVPGSQQLSLKLPTGGDAQPANAEIIGKYRALLPKPFDEKAAGFGLSASLQANDAVWTLVGLHPQAGRKVEFFPLPPDAVQVGHPVIETAGDGSGGQDFDVRLPISDGLDHARELSGVVVLRGDDQRPVGWVISGAGLTARSAVSAKDESGGRETFGGCPGRFRRAGCGRRSDGSRHRRENRSGRPASFRLAALFFADRVRGRVDPQRDAVRSAGHLAQAVLVHQARQRRPGTGLADGAGLRGGRVRVVPGRGGGGRPVQVVGAGRSATAFSSKIPGSSSGWRR